MRTNGVHSGVAFTDHLAAGGRRELRLVHRASAHVHPSLSYTPASIFRAVTDFVARARIAFDTFLENKIAARSFWSDEPRVICSSCIDFNPRDAKNRGASHGMCPRCVAKFEGRLPS